MLSVFVKTFTLGSSTTTWHYFLSFLTLLFSNYVGIVGLYSFFLFGVLARWLSTVRNLLSIVNWRRKILLAADEHEL